jgi:hypothetical protein
VKLWSCEKSRANPAPSTYARTTASQSHSFSGAIFAPSSVIERVKSGQMRPNHALAGAARRVAATQTAITNQRGRRLSAVPTPTPLPPGRAVRLRICATVEREMLRNWPARYVALLTNVPRETFATCRTLSARHAKPLPGRPVPDSLTRPRQRTANSANTLAQPAANSLTYSASPRRLR